MQYRYLISKGIDPIFGVGIGAVSYFLYEDRIERPKEHRLNSLIASRLKEWREGRA